MIDPTSKELEENYDPFKDYKKKYVLDALLKIFQYIIDWQFGMFNMHQAERLMLDVYHYTLKYPECGHTWTDEEQTRWVSPTAEEFRLGFIKLVERHKYHAELERLNFQCELLHIEPKKAKYPLLLHYTEEDIKHDKE